jgi:hypothetical protein
MPIPDHADGDVAFMAVEALMQIMIKRGLLSEDDIEEFVEKIGDQALTTPGGAMRAADIKDALYLVLDRKKRTRTASIRLKDASQRPRLSRRADTSSRAFWCAIRFRCIARPAAGPIGRARNNFFATGRHEFGDGLRWLGETTVRMISPSLMKVCVRRRSDQ